MNVSIIRTSLNLDKDNYHVFVLFFVFCQVSFVSGNVLVLHCNTDGIEEDT